MDFERETLIIIKTAAKGRTYFHIGAAHCLKAMHIPYTGMCGTVYRRIYTVFVRKEHKFAE